MTPSPARVPRPHPPPPAWRWRAMAAVAALAAIVLLALHTNRLIIAAGLFAAGAAGTALATARLRSRQDSSADITAIIAVVLILAIPLLVLLGIVKATQRADSSVNANFLRPVTQAGSAARPAVHGPARTASSLRPGQPPDAAVNLEQPW